MGDSCQWGESITFDLLYHISIVAGGGATGRALDLAISRSWVQILLGAKLRNNLWQVVHTYVPLSLSSITWYQGAVMLCGWEGNRRPGGK